MKHNGDVIKKRLLAMISQLPLKGEYGDILKQIEELKQ